MARHHSLATQEQAAGRRFRILSSRNKKQRKNEKKEEGSSSSAPLGAKPGTKAAEVPAWVKGWPGC